MKKILLVLLIVFGFYAEAQNKDSLSQVWRDSSKPDSVRLKAAQSLAWMYLFQIPDSAVSIGLQEFSFAEKNNNTKAQANALRIVTKGLYFTGNYPLALEYTFKTLKLNEELNDKKGIADSYNMLGNLHHVQGESEKALEYHFKSLKLKEETNYKEGIGGSYNNIGNIYLQQNKLEGALNNFLKGLRVFEDLKQQRNVAGVNTNIAEVYLRMNNFEKALEHYAITKKISEELNDKASLSNVFGGLGNVALKKGEFAKAKTLCEEGLKIARELNLLGEIQGNCNCLYEAYSKLGDYKKAFEYHKEFIAARDSLSNEDRTKEITSKIFQFNYEKKVAADSVKNAGLQRIKDAEQKSKLQQEATQRYALYIILALVLVFAVLMYNRFNITRKQNIVIENQKKEVEKQKSIIEEKNKEVLDSIHYAKRIQQALLASDTLLQKNLGEHFIFFQPKDIVSGDFYWAAKVNVELRIKNEQLIGTQTKLASDSRQETDNQELFYLAVCDSTGHGVPGAFMSLLNISFLNEAVNEKKFQTTDAILNHVRKRLIESLNHDSDSQGGKDGMDCSLLCFETSGDKRTLHFSCANNPILIVRNKEVISFAADRMPVGKSPKEELPFTIHSFNLQKGDVVYAFTDGFADQFGGDRGKKYKYKNLIDGLVQNSQKNLASQKQSLDEIFNKWKGNLEQVDDVLVVGIRI